MSEEKFFRLIKLEKNIRWCSCLALSWDFFIQFNAASFYLSFPQMVFASFVILDTSKSNDSKSKKRQKKTKKVAQSYFSLCIFQNVPLKVMINTAENCLVCFHPVLITFCDILYLCFWLQTSSWAEIAQFLSLLEYKSYENAMTTFSYVHV